MATKERKLHPNAPKPGVSGTPLKDLVSVGPAFLKDFELLGIASVEELAKREPEELYRALCRKTGKRQDPCVLDTFHAAIAQARDPRLPLEKCRWWYWSAIRKQTDKKG